MTSLLRQFDPATAVGRPIRVQQCDKPTLDEVVRIQGQYIEELMRYASKFVCGMGISLIRVLAGSGIPTRTSLRVRGGAS